MNIKIILNQPYPHGMACTNRVHYYAKGLQENGHQVEIIIPIPLENRGNTKNYEAQGIYEGIPFLYANQTTLRSKHFLKRRWQDIIGPIKAAYRIISGRNVDAVLLISTHADHIALFKLITWLCEALYIHERSELPFAFSKQRGSLHRLYQKAYNQLVPKCFDGMLVISTQLQTFLKPYSRKNTRLLLVPIIVNLEEFDQPLASPSENYLAYAGNLSNFKDGIDTLISAFHKVVQQMPNMQLYLIGKPSEGDKKRTESLLNKYQLNDKVFLTGYVSRTKLTEYMQNARALVLAKPDSVQADFCFPSKLGEYLATGNPVVTTRVGEIPYYLEDNKSALLANPDDPTNFADKLLKVLSDAEAARRIGLAGKKVAQEKFNYKIQGKRISDFLYQLSPQKQKA